MTNKTELLTCPFCGETLSVNKANLGVHPRFSECLYAQQVVVADDPVQVRKWNTRAVPAEDVHAVVDEPVDNEQTVYLIVFDDYDVRPETVIGEAAARQRYTQLSNNWNAHLFVKLESNSRDDPHAKSNYRHPQRPVVMPARRAIVNSGKYDREDREWNACLDEYKRLNP